MFKNATQMYTVSKDYLTYINHIYLIILTKNLNLIFIFVCFVSRNTLFLY
ncbi:hypothetical protein KL86DYS2_10612 [uncultured Dysgonomonas sp.]|uniref:Uncharacterized protein n=1 Tax=uncultured Dysgonomonas sp. TaxID=206096 RepID=A0A212J320_9BACT|nr:hypothetical protein KL86DYS2_10612 [uncultured Dysgonomonas sp.]